MMKNKPTVRSSATKRNGDDPEVVQPTRDWTQIGTLIAGIVNIGLFLLGAVGAYLIYQQIILMRESNEATRLSNELSLRAWVGIEAIEELPLRPGPSRLLIRLHNTGNTPASNVNVVTGFRVRELPLPENDPVVA
ncbi:MAG TPA: hypothetical protein VFQ06_04820, partial [Nitrospira sp.]|nr:hypothetical protein [Nitrospira sp.]